MTVIKFRQNKSNRICLTWHCIRTLVSILLGLTLGSVFYHTISFNNSLSPNDINQAPVLGGTSPSSSSSSSSSLVESFPESVVIEDPLFKNPFDYHVDEAPPLLTDKREAPQWTRMNDMERRIDGTIRRPLARQRKEKRRNELPLPGFQSQSESLTPPININDMNFLKRSSMEPLLPADTISENVSSGTLNRSDEVTGSIFDCEGEQGKCRYFYPSHFFIAPSNSTNTSSFSRGSQYGKGSKFYHLLDEMESLIQQRKLWLHMPYTGLWTMSFSDDKINPETNRPFQKQNVTFLHVHKTVSFLSLHLKMYCTFLSSSFLTVPSIFHFPRHFSNALFDVLPIREEQLL